MYLDDALQGYWLERRRSLSDHTVADYTLTFRRLREFVGAGCHIEEITADQLRQFLNHLQERYDLADKTLANAWVALSAL
jgi:site-specific recombinase XerD